ncbi:MAG: PHP domain-containing protein [Tissierellia bacterium]|nr:PHP domain-containing protein [Tissierellia bacterium]
MKKVDMHIHTSASDGTWDVEELKRELVANKIDVFSITDHDSISNVKNMEDIIRPKDNILFIPGVELSSEHEGKEYHLTLYNYDINHKGLLDLIEWTNNNKLSSNRDYIASYAANKYEDVSVEDFEKYEFNRKRGGWKSAWYMFDKGIHKNIPEHLKDVYASGLKAKLKSPQEVIDIAKKSGGKVFLAHPSYHFREGMPKEELKFWLECGIDGIECYSPYNKGASQQYIDFCKKNNLMISGGSDCHGNFIPSRKLGNPTVSLEDLNIKKLM